MIRTAALLCLGLACLAHPPTLLAQTSARDPDVAKGIEQVNDGDYDGAIFTLDQAARRLAADNTRVREMSEAYLYLGIAYVGKGHEAAAKAKFREALAGITDLSLSPEKFPPKVIDLFEAARSEARREAAPVQPAPAAVKKGGGGKGLLIGALVVAAAGGGVAAAAGGGGEGGAGPAPPSSVTQSYPGILTHSQSAALINLPVAESSGGWKAELEWNAPGTEVRMFVLDSATREGVAETRLIAPTACVAEWEGVAGKRYQIELFLQEGGASEVNYICKITHPR